MGFDGLKKVGAGDSEMECGTKQFEKKLQDFLTFFTHGASKVEILSTELL